MKLLLQQLGTLGEVLDCTTLCKPSPHPCLPRANHTHQIWVMGRGDTASAGLYDFLIFQCLQFSCQFALGSQAWLGKHEGSNLSGFVVMLCALKVLVQEITRNVAKVPGLAQLVMILSG